MNDTAYDRRDVQSILEYLKDKAEELSEGRWTDFSSGDIGSILLGLMSYLADANNFQIDKTASELYLDTAVERTSLMALLKLIGYTPRHYMSAYTTIRLQNLNDTTTTVIPAYSYFTNNEGTVIYTALEEIQINNGTGYGILYEGTRATNQFTYDQITKQGRIYLPDYKLGLNTVQVKIPGISTGFLDRVEDVRFTAGEFNYSVHVDEYAKVYIQLPSYWTDLLTETSVVYVSYLLTQGEAGRIGSDVLTVPGTGVSLLSNYSITNPAPSEGGYFPETTDEIRVNAPRQARTMLTIVTKKDMEDLVNNIPEIASIKCGDYNDDWTTFVQPADAYKCKVLAVPSNPNETSLFTDQDQPTATLLKLQKFVDERRLASLMIYYEDPKRILPEIILDIYTDENDLRASTIATNVKMFMQVAYGRTRMDIGKSLYGSVIGKDLLNVFPEITYLEVHAPEHNIPCAPDEYIDMAYAKFKINVNDVTVIDEITGGGD